MLRLGLSEQAMGWLPPLVWNWYVTACSSGDTTHFWHLTAKLILFIEADNGQKWKTEEVDKTDIYETELN